MRGHLEKPYFPAAECQVLSEMPPHCSLSLQVVINGGATSSGEQDNEDTELMAVYTTENGIAEKVPMPTPSYCPTLSGEPGGSL